MGTSSRVIDHVLTIAEGETISNVLRGWNQYGGSAGLTIFSPSNLVETVNIQVCWEELKDDEDGTEWFNWFDGVPLVQQTVPPASAAQPMPLLVTVRNIRLVSDGAVPEDRVFHVNSQATN